MLSIFASWVYSLHMFRTILLFMYKIKITSYPKSIELATPMMHLISLLKKKLFYLFIFKRKIIKENPYFKEAWNFLPTIINNIYIIFIKMQQPFLNYQIQWHYWKTIEKIWLVINVNPPSKLKRKRNPTHIKKMTMKKGAPRHLKSTKSFN